MLLKSSDIDVTVQSVVIEVENTSTEMDPNTFATVHYVNTKLNDKVDKIEGHRLLTPEEADKLEHLEEGGQRNVQSDWKETDETSDAFIKNKPTTAKEFGLTDVYSIEDIDDKLTEVNNKLTQKADKYNVFSKTETKDEIVKSLISVNKEINLLKVNKADASLAPRVSKLETKLDNFNTDIEEKIATKADKTSVYTKLETNALVNSVDESLKSRISQLNNIKADKTLVYTKEESDTQLASKASDLEDKINVKADKTDVYTKQEVDYKFSTIPDDLVSRIDSKADKADTYTKEEVTELVAGASGPLKELIDSKADKSDITKLDDKITITKNAFLSELSTKASRSEVYKKTEIDNQLSTINQKIDDGLSQKYNKNEVYTKTETDNLLTPIQDSLTTLETKTEEISGNTYTKDVIDANFNNIKTSLTASLSGKIDTLVVNDKTIEPAYNDETGKTTASLSLRLDDITERYNTSLTDDQRDAYKVQEAHLSDWVLAKINSYANRRQADWIITDPNRLDFIRNKPTKLSQFENDIDVIGANYIDNVKNLPEAENLVTTSVSLTASQNNIAELSEPINISECDIYVNLSLADKNSTLKEYLLEIDSNIKDNVTYQKTLCALLESSNWNQENPYDPGQIYIIKYIRQYSEETNSINRFIALIVRRPDNSYGIGATIAFDDVVDNSITFAVRNATATTDMTSQGLYNYLCLTSATSPYTIGGTDITGVGEELEKVEQLRYVVLPIEIRANITINKAQDDYELIQNRAESIAKLNYSSHVLEGEIYNLDSTDFEFRRKIGVLWERMGGTVYSDGNFRH